MSILWLADGRHGRTQMRQLIWRYRFDALLNSTFKIQHSRFNIQDKELKRKVKSKK
jgi:hypothetical protein